MDVSLCCEVWEKAEDKKHKGEIEKMLELDGLKYFSTTRPRGKRGGGAAIIVNTEKFKAEKLDIQIPHKLEVVWAIARPKNEDAQFKVLILCSFYSPPRSRLRNKLKDHIIGTLQMLTTKYGECGLFVGGDKNKMDISSLLNTNLKLKQIVSCPTRKKEILDICLTNLFAFYNAPIIIPPVQPDVPGQGVPSDHSVPLCVPHTDPFNPPKRVYKTVVSRPLPDSRIRSFGQWITAETWAGFKEEDDPSNQVKKFEQTIAQKLEKHFPIKTTKIGVGDKPYITSDLKKLKRKRMREYRERGKSLKYERLKTEFKEKLEKAAQNFLRKNVDSLKESNPGQAYNILKKMGAQPGECEEQSSFTLPSHSDLTPLESAEKIAEHFSKISREFPPLNMETLPERVVQKLDNPEAESKIPIIQEHEVLARITHANKPKSGVPGDMPRKLVTEFAPELSTPTCRIFNSIVKSAREGVAKWPNPWKKEFGTPLQKIQDPVSEDDLRIISLTAFFSKVMEKFVVEWLMVYIEDKIDPKQFGGLKGNSISHYMIELINFILHQQEYNLPIAVLLCAIDFSKAFNRQNHNILVTILSDMGVPGWLLNIVMGFLTERIMVVRFKGETTAPRSLPGGGPQGTLLGLLLFLVLVNFCGFDSHQDIGSTITNPKKKFKPATFHSKYVDDLTIAESFNIKESVVPDPDRPLPDTYHARLGQKLPADQSQVYKQLDNVQEYARNHEMKINFAKTKFMLFNPTVNYDFVPQYSALGNEVETYEEMKLLGIVIQNDLKWKSNTDNMTQRAYKKLWMVKRLRQNGANFDDMTDVYVKQIRSILEFGTPVWNPNLTQDDISSIERVQKSFLHIVLGQRYKSYESALRLANLESLEQRRTKLCLSFATKATKHPKHQSWFVANNPPDTRSKKVQLKPPLCRMNRYAKSPIPYLTNLLNSRKSG